MNYEYIIVKIGYAFSNLDKKLHRLLWSEFDELITVITFVNPVVNDHLSVFWGAHAHSIHTEVRSNEVNVITLSDTECVVEVTDDLLHQHLRLLHIVSLQERENICDVFTSQLTPALCVHLGL